MEVGMLVLIIEMEVLGQRKTALQQVKLELNQVDYLHIWDLLEIHLIKEINLIQMWLRDSLQLARELILINQLKLDKILTLDSLLTTDSPLIIEVEVITTDQTVEQEGWIMWIKDCHISQK